MIVYCKNFHHVQKLQKWAYNKGIKPKSYASGEKAWLNRKYIRAKQNQNLEAKFSELFRVFYPIGKQVYKLELSKNWKIHDVFHMSLLEHDTIKKRRVDKKVRQIKFDNNVNDSGEYKVEVI